MTRADARLLYTSCGDCILGVWAREKVDDETMQVENSRKLKFSKLERELETRRSACKLAAPTPSLPSKVTRSDSRNVKTLQ